jgi:hypothetical protein
MKFVSGPCVHHDIAKLCQQAYIAAPNVLQSFFASNSSAGAGALL